MHKSISNILSRRNMIKGGAAAVAVSVTVPALAQATEDEVQIIRAAIKEVHRIGKVHTDAENECYRQYHLNRHSEAYKQAIAKERQTEQEYADSWGYVDNYPVKTFEGLEEKVKFLLRDKGDYAARIIKADIERISAN